jgi:hypothetical protein
LLYYIIISIYRPFRTLIWGLCRPLLAVVYYERLNITAKVGLYLCVLINGKGSCVGHGGEKGCSGFGDETLTLREYRIVGGKMCSNHSYLSIGQNARPRIEADVD